MTALHFAPPIGEPPAIQFVGVDRLKVDTAYQRPTDNKTSRKLIERIAERWDWRLCSPLIVSQRSAGLFVIDGQHRAEAARLRGDIAHLPVVALFDLTLADEARIFAAVNHERKTVTRLDSFRAALAAEDEAAITIRRLVDEAGLSIASSNREASLEPGAIAFTALIERALRKRGEHVVGEALRLMGEAFRGEVLGEAGGALFSALGLLLASYERRPEALLPVLASRRADGWAAAVRASGVTGGGQRTAVLRDMLIAGMVDEAGEPEDPPASPPARQPASPPARQPASPPAGGGKRVRSFEEQLAAVRAGAHLVEVWPLRRPEPDMTLGGVASGTL